MDISNKQTPFTGFIRGFGVVNFPCQQRISHRQDSESNKNKICNLYLYLGINHVERQYTLQYFVI